MTRTRRKIDARSLPEQVADWLIKEISEERLKPGQRITEQFVIDQCQFSRGPIRDAFRIVEKIGLIQLLPRRGAVVAPIDLDELTELFAIRAALTRVLVSRAIGQASDEQLRGLVIEAGNLLEVVDDEASFFGASNTLGERFLDLAESSKLRDLLEPLQIQISRYRHHGFSSLAARQASASGYLAIAEAMEKRDESLALETVDASVRRLVNEVVKAFTP